MEPITKDFFPTDLLVPPHEITSKLNVWHIYRVMKKDGWVGPALVGYKDEDHIQLLTGAHRKMAAMFAKIRVPVVLYAKEDIIEMRSNSEEWNKILDSGIQFSQIGSR